MTQLIRKLAGSILVVGLALFGAVFNVVGATGSYSIYVDTNVKFPCAWSFQNEAIASAFPSPHDADKIFIWDANASAYLASTFDSLNNAWNNNYTLTNGVGFYYQSGGGGPRTITITGTLLTASSVSFNFVSGKQYFIGMAYLFPSTDGFLECVQDTRFNNYPYTAVSFHYPANNGDHIFTWNDCCSPSEGLWKGGIRRGTDCYGTSGTPFWESDVNSCTWAWATYTPPQALPGFGFWFYPAANSTWTQYSGGETNCP